MDVVKEEHARVRWRDGGNNPLKGAVERRG